MELKEALNKIATDYPVMITVGNLIVYQGPLQLDISKYAVDEYMNKTVMAYGWNGKYNVIYCKGDLYVIDK